MHLRDAGLVDRHSPVPLASPLATAVAVWTMSKKTGPKPALEGVAAVGRALSILSAFRKGDEAVPLAELAERTGLVKSTIMRLAISLEEYGFLAHQADGSYRLDAEVMRLGSIYQQAFRLETHVMPALEALVDKTGESASFYIQRGNERLCLFRVDSPHRLRLVVRQGDMLPMDGSAIAQVLRTFGAVPLPASAAKLDLPMYTAGANDPHVAGMAMPVFGPDDAFAGALSITGPITRLTREAAAAAASTLQDAARELTRALGGQPPRFTAAATTAAAQVSGASSTAGRGPPRRFGVTRGSSDAVNAHEDRSCEPRRTSSASAASCSCGCKHGIDRRFDERGMGTLAPLRRRATVSARARESSLPVSFATPVGLLRNILRSGDRR